MASTRLKNAPMTYNREKNTYIKSYNNRSYVGKILNDNKYLPGLGINAPFMPNGMNNNILSNNGPDIESALFGIGSTNLVQPKKPTCGNMNHLQDVNFFKAKAESNNKIPEPLVVHNNERYTIFRR
tara:strand:- start:88 stop:465 length:378 start_codon:yes stop_codon:yes gene_type:complete